MKIDRIENGTVYVSDLEPTPHDLRYAAFYRKLSAYGGNARARRLVRRYIQRTIQREFEEASAKIVRP